MTLTIDSSSKSASCALFDKKLIAMSFQDSGLTHSSTLLTMVESMLKNSGYDKTKITEILVANGPGSFTGLRIGVACALGLSVALDVPCFGVSTLEALAFSCSGDAHIVAVMDARRDEFYIAEFSGGKRITPDEVLPFSKIRPSGSLFCGDGAEKIVSGYGEVAKRVMPTAYGIYFAEKRTAEHIEYLRLPQAERERLKKLS